MIDFFDQKLQKDFSSIPAKKIIDKRHRIGGPTKYEIDHNNGKLLKLLWRINGIKYKSGTYWGTLIDRYPQVYNPKFGDTRIFKRSDGSHYTRQKIFLFSAKNVPAPKYIEKVTVSWIEGYCAYTTIWYLNGKRTTMSKYWYQMEKVVAMTSRKYWRNTYT